MFNKSNLIQTVLGILVAIQSPLVSAESLPNNGVERLVPAINQFSYNFFHQIVKEGKPTTDSLFAQENQIVSGPSVHMALSLAYMGTGSSRQTQAELAEALHFSEFEKASIADSYSQLFDQMISNEANQSKSDGKPENDVSIQFANQVLASKEFAFQDSFRDLLTPFRAVVKLADFVNQPKAVLDGVNAWVSDQTQGKISSILESLKPTDKMLLLSTVYFKGAWQKAFSRTAPDAFYTDSAKSVCLLKQVPLMHKSDTNYYYEDDSQQVLEIPYLSSNQSSVAGNNHSAWGLFVILPKAGFTLANVQESLDPATFEGILEKMTQTKVNITLPKFKVEQEFNLKTSLKALGIDEAFTDRADFTSMMYTSKNESVPFMISDVKNKVFIDLDEKGTEAASVVAISMRVTSHIARRGPTPKDFRADHPFYFMLRNNETGLILFQGMIVKPAK